MPSSTRKNVTMAKRIEIIKKLQTGARVSDLANKYGLAPRTIRRYRKNATAIRLFVENGKCMNVLKRRDSFYKDLNVRLHDWFLEKHEMGNVVTDTILQEKAMELCVENGGPSDFNANQEWLWRFKAKYNIQQTNIDQERAEANRRATADFTKMLVDLMVKEDIKEENLYNIHESSLMWKLLPQETLMHDGEQWMENRNLKKDCVTIAFCVNATGTHKLPVLFVHKYVNPRALKHCRNSLPVIYKHQINARVNENLFVDWYINDFKPCMRKKQLEEQRIGKVVLLVSNFRGNMIPEAVREDNNFKLIFLRPSITSLIQLMDQGVIVKFKKLFRHRMLRRALQYEGKIMQFYADYDIKDCIDFVSEAWSEITQKDIKNSWMKLLGKQLSDTFERHNMDLIDDDHNDLSNLSNKDISEWMSECEKTESVIEDEGKEEDKQKAEKYLQKQSEQHRCPIDDEEIEQMFYKLAIWSETKPDFVKQHTKLLIDYHNKN